MRIGILGSGDVAQALGSGFLAKGDEVMLGTRDAGKLSEWKSKNGERASVGSFAEAARFGEMIVIATHGTASHEVLESAGLQNFAGKLVLDTTNPLEMRDGKLDAPQAFLVHSLGEQIQGWIPGARVVKVFNSVGNQFMVDPAFPEGPPDMFIAGNDAAAKSEVTQLLRRFGWNAIDLGDITSSRVLEAMALAWIWHGQRTGAWNHAYKFIRTP